MKASTEIAGTALAAWLERDEAELAGELTQPMALRGALHCPSAKALRDATHVLLHRTIEHLHDDKNPSLPSPCVEVLIGGLAPRYPSARPVSVTWTEHEIILSNTTRSAVCQADLHPIVITIAACYIAAAAVNALLDYAFSPAARPVRIPVRSEE